MSQQLRIKVNGKAIDIALLSTGPAGVRFKCGDRTYEVGLEETIPSSSDKTSQPAKSKAAARSSTVANSSTVTVKSANAVHAPIPGTVLELSCSVGDSVKKGQLMLRIEAMKMENNIFSPRDGKIKRILVSTGDEVRDSQLLIEFV